MKHHDDRQPSLFDDLPVANRDAEPKPATVLPPFDPRLLPITEYDGEPFVLETDLGAQLGYTRADNIKRLIDRLEKRPSWGSLRYRDAMIQIGKGGRRLVRQRLLTEKQLVLTCMACELPNLDEVQSLIAEVFIAWHHGKMRPGDAHTEVKIQEATDQAIDAMPAFFEWSREIQETGRAAREAKRAAERAARAAEESIANQRRYPEKETVYAARWVNKNNYRDRCPCCQRVILGGSGGVWAHMKGRYRRTVRDGWFVCEKCNVDYENAKNTSEIYIAFIAYLGHVEAYLAQGQFHFAGKP